MHRSFTVVAVLLAGFVGISTASAQVTNTGTIQAFVMDQGNLPVPGADVTAESSDGLTRRSAVTDANGQALLVGLEPSARYVVTTTLAGFVAQRFENQLVRSGQITTLRITLSVGGLNEQVQVTAESPIVDTTSATQSTDITLQLTESLPTGRSYQSYLQIVPGVMPDDPSLPGNPASKSGINYSDIGGNVGVSTDNAYYVDGINVTDPQSGTFGANLNTEIIQEQKVITGAIPAEYVGIPGLLSNVITKAGSNAYRGSANYFFQNAGLQADNKNSTEQEFSTFDTAFTAGGPIVRDRAWAFGSFRYLHREDDVTALDTNQLLRTVEDNQKQGYFRGTLAATAHDTISFTFLNDPTDKTGRIERDITNARDRVRTQGGGRYAINYSRVFGSALIEAAYNKHNGELSDLSKIRESFNTVLFRSTDTRTLADEQLGGLGTDTIDERDVDGARGALSWVLRGHSLKTGLEFQRNSRFLNSLTIGDTRSTYTSLGSSLSGFTANQVDTESLSGSKTFRNSNVSDFGGFIRTINGLPNRAAFYAAFDANGDGTITAAEYGARALYNVTAGNPHGRVNYSRTFQSADGPQEFTSDGLSFFIQDSFPIGRLTINAGVRTERWEHFATTDASIHTFDWSWGPRLSAAYDLFGDGKQKVSAYWGRYYDPVRTNMTAFAGSLTGRTREEQVFVANGINQWVTYRVRGGAILDGFFAPTTKTPFTDDLQMGYQVDLGHNMSFDTTYNYRRTRDILEDYDPALYAQRVDGTTDYPANAINDPNSLFLGLDYFGFDVNPGANFIIATLEGGERNYHGLEMNVRKRFSDNWQGLVSYTYNNFKGNSNSDSNADFQGDVIELDPRAPNNYGRQPGTITHLFKMGGSYNLPMGLELGGNYRWNSGTVASRTYLASGRNLPIQVSPSQQFAFAGITHQWVDPTAVGTLTNPSWGQLDLRVKYSRQFGPIRPEVFVDIFNVLNDQDSIRNQDLVAGSGTIAFGQPIRYLDPQRFFLGVRLNY
jgi:hypothetical protein